VVPHINIRSPPLRPVKFVIGEIKRLLQHYRRKAARSYDERLEKARRIAGCKLRLIWHRA
jgi:hypothetical protein